MIYDPTNLTRLSQAVKRFIKPPLDAENIAGDIVLEHLRTKRVITSTVVRSRSIDAVRRYQTEQKHNELYHPQSRSERPVEPMNEQALWNLAMIEYLTKRAELNAHELGLIFYRFYRGLTQEQIASQLGLVKSQVHYQLACVYAKLKRVYDEQLERQERTGNGYVKRT